MQSDVNFGSEKQSNRYLVRITLLQEFLIIAKINAATPCTYKPYFIVGGRVLTQGLPVKQFYSSQEGKGPKVAAEEPKPEESGKSEDKQPAQTDGEQAEQPKEEQTQQPKEEEPEQPKVEEQLEQSKEEEQPGQSSEEPPKEEQPTQ